MLCWAHTEKSLVAASETTCTISWTGALNFISGSKLLSEQYNPLKPFDSVQGTIKSI